MSQESRNPEKLSESEKRDILRELEDRHTEMRDNQREIRRRWIKVQGAVDGRQVYPIGDAGLDGSLGIGWELAQAPSATGNVDDESVIFNDLRRVYNTDMQRMTSYYLRPEVVPENKDPEMKEGARLGRIWLANHIRQTGPERMKQVMARSLILRNIVIMKAHFDPQTGRVVKKPRWKFGRWGLGSKWEHEGDIVWDFPNPKCVLVPKYTKTIENATEVEEYHIMSVDEVFRRYKVVVDPEPVDPDYYDALDRGLTRDTEGGTSTEKVHDMVLLKEKIVMPCPRYPEGAMFTWTTKHLIRSDKLRYPGNPYFGAQLVGNDERAFCDSILWDLMPIQGYLNLGLSATARWLKMISLLRRWIPSSTQVKAEDLDNATGMNSVYEGKDMPQWEKVPELPQSIFNLIDLSRDFIASHGYSNELAKTRRALSGNALGILQEMDDTIFRPGLENLQGMLNRASEFSLRVAAERITTPRLIKMATMQGWQIVKGFKGEMLNGNFHADINLMAGMPSNKVLRLEYLKSLYKDGLLSKEQTQAYLEFPSDTQALEDVQKQYEIASKRVQALLKFPENYKKEFSEADQAEIWVTTVQYHDFDNHGLIMAKLQEAMQEGYDEWNDWVQIAFLEHWKYAKERKAIQDQEAAMMAAGGGEGLFPGPPAKAGEGVDGMLGAALGTADSHQAPSQQPGRGTIPQPMATEFTT